MAEGHEDSQRMRLERMTRQLRVIGAFKAAGKKELRVRAGSVLQTRQDLASLREAQKSEKAPSPFKLKRRDTLRPLANPTPGSLLGRLWERARSFPCFRGFIAFLIMAVPRWYLSQVTDLLLSGQPADLQLGYGSTSIVLATCFGGGFAVWTHYCITRSSSQKILRNFPRGKEVLAELWPITALWAIFEHLPLSLSLSLSRFWGLKQYADDPATWNLLDERGEQYKVAQFASVLLVYGFVTAVFAVPATMLVRRVYASMLSDDDLAIVPFNRGSHVRHHKYDERSKLHKPGLAISEAWKTITIQQYIRVLQIYMQYFAVNQLIQLAYWSANWKLQEYFQVDPLMNSKLPESPIGIILPYALRNATFPWPPRGMHSEL